MTTRRTDRTRRRRRARNAADYLFGSPAPSRVRLVHGLLPLIELLDAHGHAVEPILAHAEIARFALEEPGYRIHVDQEIKFTPPRIGTFESSGRGPRRWSALRCREIRRGRARRVTGA